MIYVERFGQLITSIPQDDYSLHLNPSISNQVAVKLNQVSIRHNPKLPLVLSNVNLEINQNEKLTIVGRTGAGKTTLIQGISNLIPCCEGSIEIFGQKESVRQYFSVVTQDPFVFEGTLKDNIDPINKYQEEAIIAKFQNYEIPILQNLRKDISELGGNLSLGEKQLIVLIRTILQDREIIILDECTGNLDKEYSKIVLEMLQDYIKNKTTISITHKLEQIQEDEKVIRIENKNLTLVDKIHK